MKTATTVIVTGLCTFVAGIALGAAGWGIIVSLTSDYRSQIGLDDFGLLAEQTASSESVCRESAGCIEAMQGDDFYVLQFGGLNDARAFSVYATGDVYRSDQFVATFSDAVSSENRLLVVQSLEGIATTDHH